MDTKIIGQGYNLKQDSSVAKELIEQFNSNRYDSFTCLVAFASYGGISAMTPYIMRGKKRGMDIRIILGVDQKGTSKEALEEVLSWGVDAKIYHTQSINIFHPKIYLFENIDIFTLIVGSNNLTEMGLVSNVECSLLIKDIKSNTAYSKFYDYWGDMVDGNERDLYSLNTDLIERLYNDKIITSEYQRSGRYDNGCDHMEGSPSPQTNFRTVPVQRCPQGFTPKRLVKVKKSVKSDSKVSDTGNNIVNVSLPISDDVLIAEIGGGPRWKQVNFPVEIFENFFGAQRGDNSYNIELMNIMNDGTLGEVEIRQAVSVKSRNYRFEIHCEETSRPYPGANNRPIGLFVKIDRNSFFYQVLLPDHPVYEQIKAYLYKESKIRRDGELRRHIVHVEAIHALYPDLVI